MDNRRMSLRPSHLGHTDDMSDIEANDGSNPSSKLLQDLLREKKAQSRKVEKAHNPNPRPGLGRNNSLPLREAQSSPIPSAANRDFSATHGRRTSHFGRMDSLTPKEWGIRELDEVSEAGLTYGKWHANIEQQFAKLNKENFDLKLEVSQRRKRQEILNAKLERLPTLEANNGELQSINDALLRELQKRDQAIKEAVELICELEGKLEAADSSKDDQGPYSPHSDLNSPASNETQDIPSSPPLDAKSSASPHPDPYIEDEDDEITDLPSTHPTSTSPLDSACTIEPFTSAQKTPSFIRDKKRSTRALRGLYLNNESFNSNLSLVSLARPNSIFGRDDLQGETDADSYALNSPRLSVLSESSFLSVYGKQKDSDQASDGQEEDQPGFPLSGNSNRTLHPTHGGARLQDQIDERNKPSTPSRNFTRGGPKDPFTSIGKVLHDAPSRRQKQHQRSLDQDHEDLSLHNGGHTLLKMPSLGGPIFGGDVLPPTPDTMSTHRKDANSSTPSIITEKSLLDGTPYSAKNISALVTETHPYTLNDIDVFKRSNASGFSLDADMEYSEAESESVQVEQSDSGAFEKGQPFAQSSTFMGGSSKAPRLTGMALPTRPPLTTYATDMMFNGEGYDAVQSSQRTISYPSPDPRVRRRLHQPPPMAYDAASARSMQLSPENNTSGSSNTATPTKADHPDTLSRSSSHLRTSSATPSHRSAHEPPPGNPSNTSSTPFNMPTQPPPPTSTRHASLASRIFRRPSAQPKPPTWEHPSSNHPPRPLSYTLGYDQTPSAQHATDPPSRNGRPGTAGSQNSAHSAASRKRSAMFDDIVKLGTEPVSLQGEKRGFSLGRSSSLRSKMGFGRRKGREE